MPDRHVLVVGPTYDYVDWLRKDFPDRCLFLVDNQELPKINGVSENCLIAADLTQPASVLKTLQLFLGKSSRQLSGLACFDDESQLLTAIIAKNLNLPYPDEQAILACRNKFLSKQLWLQAGLKCPQTKIVGAPQEGLEFMKRLKKPVVLKPLTGSGSELVFFCQDKYELLNAFLTMKTQMEEPVNPRMYASADRQYDPRQVFEIEEFIKGREYSCDFVIDDNRVNIIRTAKKIPAEHQPFGITLAYVTPVRLPGSIDEAHLKTQLRQAAHALGLHHSLCMVDFIVKGDKIYFLEMAPRPGGDCLPFLIRRSTGLDMLGLTLDRAENKPLKITDKRSWKNRVGLRIFAAREGTVKNIITDNLRDNDKVEEIYIKYPLPHKVTLPPQDYDSYILGHIIFKPNSEKNINRECRSLADKIEIIMENDKWVTAVG